MKKRTSQHGYTLLMTVLLLAMAAVIIAGLCKSSLYAAVAAKKSNTALQEKWGNLSLNQSLIQIAPEVFKQNLKNFQKQAEDEILTFVIDDQEAVSLDSLRQQSLVILLGKIPFHVIIEDEHNKLNVNQLLGRDPAHRQAVDTLSQLGQSSSLQSRISLKPLSRKNAKKLHLPRLGNLSQVFDTITAKQLCPITPDQLFKQRELRYNNRSLPQSLTCYGDAKLNYESASDAVIIAQVKHLKLDLTAIEELLLLRQENPQLPLDKQLDDLSEDSAKQKREITQMFKPKSICLSLWIISKQKHRLNYHQTIIQTAENNETTSQSFHW